MTNRSDFFALNPHRYLLAPDIAEWVVLTEASVVVQYLIPTALVDDRFRPSADIPSVRANGVALPRVATFGDER